MNPKIKNHVNRRNVTLFGISILALYLILGQWMGSDEALVKYRVTKGEFTVDIEVDGEVEALESYVIKAPSNLWGNARIVKLVPEGNHVTKGDFLIQFDTSEFQQKLMEAQNKLETARANLANTKANIESQMAELEANIALEKYSLEQSRLQAKRAVYEAENRRKEIELNLKKAEISYKQLLEKKENIKKINESKLRQAQLEVEQARIKVERAKDDLDRLTLTSPAEGMVVYKEVWEGDKMDKLKVGYSPWRGQPLMEIPTKNRMKVSVEIDEIDISQIEKDQEVRIELDALPDTTFTGKVTEVAALAHKDRRTKKNVFDVEIHMNENDERLKPGMTAHCRIIIHKLRNVLTVPVDALHTIKGKSYIIDEHGDTTRVETGLSDSDFIVVKEGLKEGQIVLLPSEQPVDALHEKDGVKSPQTSSEQNPIRVISRY